LAARAFDHDCEIAAAHGCDIVFAPSSEQMYTPNSRTFVEVEDITTVLCGASRPGHFRGVTTIVTKLFNIVGPDYAVFGQKDAQQVLVIRRMVEDLNTPVLLVVGPTVREEDGLAMSSRNRYLTPAERAEAPTLYAGLEAARALFDRGERNATELLAGAKDCYGTAGLLEIEYLEIVDTVTLQPLPQVAGTALMAVAGRTRQSGTRLIDNVVLGGTL
jgi:pantoate--beta-alanine ligase